MARRSTEEKLNLYKQNVQWALRVMQPMHDDWKRYAKMYANEQWQDGPKPEDAITVNQIAPIVNTILPSMYTNQPKIRAKPLRPQDAEKAPLVEQVLNYDWRRIRVDEELRKSALDMLVYGMGWVLVGYEYEEAEMPREEADIEGDLQQLMSYVLELAGGVPPARVGNPEAGVDELGASADAMGMDPETMLQGPDAMQQFMENPESALGAQPQPMGIQPQQVGPQAQGQTMEQAAGGQYGSPAGAPTAQTGPQAQAPGPVGTITPGPEAPPILQALLNEETGGQPAEDTVDLEQIGGVLEDGLQPTMGGPGMNAIDPSMLPTEEELRAYIPRTETVPTKDDIFVEHVSPFDVLVDPEARDMNHARWVARKRTIPLSDVLDNPVYRNKKGLQGDSEFPSVEGMDKPPEIPGYDQGQTHLAPERERVTLWEYYDLKKHTLCVFTLGHDKFLFEADWQLPFDESPFIPMVDYVVPDSLWGFGEVALIEGLQNELNKTRTQIIVHNKRFNRKLLYKERAIDERGKAALESRVDGVMIPVINETDLKDAVLPIPDSPLPADRYQLNNIIESDLQAVTGISDYERGAYNNVRRTATEASIIMDSSSLRQQDKLRRIENAATEVGRRMKALAQTFYDSSRWILITGSGWQVPIRFSKEDIEGEYDVQVDAGSTEPTNQQMLMQDRERLFQVVGGSPAAGLVNWVELLKELLRAHGMTNPDRMIDQNAVAMMQMQQMLAGQQGAMQMAGGQQQGLPGAQPGQLGPGSPEEVQQGVVGGAQAAGVPA